MAPSWQSSSMLEGIPAVRFGDGIAFLDVTGDAYSCIYDPVGRAEAETLPDTRAAAGAPSPTAASIRQWRDLPGTHARVRPCDIWQFVLALVVTTVRFRGRDFAALLETDIIGKAGHATRSNDEVADLVARFESMSLFLPFPMLCLFRSFFLLHFLARHGHAADWVFGVTLFPFRAHCWLAIGDSLVGETSRRAVEFSPILIVAKAHA